MGAHRIKPGKWKNTKGPSCCPSQVSGVKIEVEECCLDGVTLWAPMACFCHAAVPCGACEECGDDKETECYYTWQFCNAAAFQVLTARDGGTKFTNEGPGCFDCGDWELEEAAGGAGTPQSVEMQRA